MTLLLSSLALLAPLGGGDEKAPGISLAELLQSDALDSLRVGGLLRAYGVMADDELSAVAGEDVEALRLNDAQLWFSAEAMGYEVFVKLDSGEATAFPPIDGDGVQSDDLLRDAWVRKEVADNIWVYIGQYKCPLVASGNVGDGSLSMIDRTRIGYLFSFPGAYQPGVAVMGDFGDFHVKLALQNGADSAVDGFGMVVRGEYKVGEGAKQREGALGNQGLNATVGIGYFQDDSQIAGEDFGSGMAVDAYVTYDQISVHGEVLDADEELASRALGNTTDDATPFSLTGGFLFAEDFEAFLRVQDLDNEVDATLAAVGLNYYVNGHATKWQFNVEQYDDDNIDGTVIEAGLAIGYSDRY